MTTLLVNGVEVLPTGPTLYWLCFSRAADCAASPGVAVPFSTATRVCPGGHGPLPFFPDAAVDESDPPLTTLLTPNAIPATTNRAPTAITAIVSGSDSQLRRSPSP